MKKYEVSKEGVGLRSPKATPSHPCPRLR